MHCYLILGDGNFSFSLALSGRVLRTPGSCKIVATSLESLDTVISRTLAEENLRKLRTCYEDVQVLHEVDGTRLGTNKAVKALSVLFDTIIFNFPHTGGKSKIQCNRTLLKDYFVSVTSSKLLACEGEVHVTLCRGQGGTPADSNHRGYENSWKVVEMAAEGGLVLDRVEPFMRSYFPGYISTGYRGHSDKGFCVDGALRHVFRLPTLSKPSLYPPCFVHDVSFWCTGRVFDLEMFQDVVDEVTGGGDGEKSVRSVKLLEVYRPSVVVDAAVRSDVQGVKGDGGGITGDNRSVRGDGEGVMGNSEAVRVGYCYRVSYQSSWAAVSRSKAGHLQQLLRQALHSKVWLDLR